MGNISTDINREVLEDIGVLDFLPNSRYRVYPQDVTSGITLTASGVANTFGSWAEVIPLNTIPFKIQLAGFCMCDVSAATAYHVQFGYNEVDADPPDGLHIMGEGRMRIANVPIARQSEMLPIHSQSIPARAKIMGRVKTASGNPDTCSIIVLLTRNIDVKHEQATWPNFPW